MKFGSLRFLHLHEITRHYTEVLSVLPLRARLLTVMNDAHSLCCTISRWWTKINVPEQASVMFQNHFLSFFSFVSLLLFWKQSNWLCYNLYNFPIASSEMKRYIASYIWENEHFHFYWLVQSILKLRDVGVRCSWEDLVIWALTMLCLSLEIYRQFAE